MQLGVQEVPGFFSERWYTMFLSIDRVFYVSLSCSIIALPPRQGPRAGKMHMPSSYRDSAGSNLTTTKMSLGLSLTESCPPLRYSLISLGSQLPK